MKQISVRVSDNIHQALKEKTVKDRITVQKVLDLMIATYLDSNDSYDEFRKKLMKI